jgi:hypothetical protein
MRVSYAIGDVVFDIDCHDGIPPLLEIEAVQSKDIIAWIQKLGLSSKLQLSCGTKGLFSHYKKKTAK